jgi:hypothetical protein
VIPIPKVEKKIVASAAFLSRFKYALYRL